MTRLAILGALVLGCSSGEESPSRSDSRPTKAADAAPAKVAKAPDSPVDHWSGTFEGRTEPTPAPLPSRNIAPNTPAPDAGPSAPAWSDHGTVAFEARGDEIGGTLSGGGLSCTLGGTLVGGKLRGWIATDAAVGSRWMGRVEGAADGAAIRGTWRASSSGGVEVRAGSFEVRKAD